MFLGLKDDKLLVILSHVLVARVEAEFSESE